MVMLPVDEAYALDYYAILLVKRKHGLPVGTAIRETGKALAKQIDVWDEVLFSEEFQSLVEANQHTFDAVAECRESAAQRANRGRFEAKARLQSRFWPERPLTERKRDGE